jgi:Cu(I)/Ag(I) efflux system membrane protein CusA/SilA
MVTSIDDNLKTGPIQKLIAACASNPLLTIITVLAMGAWGYYSLRQTPLDAVPDLSDAQVIIFTEWQGQSPDLVEDQVTYPISSALLSAPNVKFVRGQSHPGLSFVYVIFEDGTDIYWARSRVLEYLNEVSGDLPEGVTPTLGPDATGVGWVFQYALIDRTGKHDLAQLRSLQDWNIRYSLESVKGVAEVASVGGFVKQYQILLDPDKLLAHKIPIKTIVQKVRRSNNDVGGRIFEHSGHEYMIRGRGYIKSKADIESIPLGVGPNGVPIQIRDVGTVKIGSDIRRGVAELNGEGEVVGGIVVMRYGENALTTIKNVKERLAEIETTLPEGVEIEIVYDRSELIERAIGTLRTTLIEELLVVSVVITVFLLHLRSALIPILMLPLAVLLAFIPMGFHGLSANIMSLGGIAVAVGAMVDASIILIENIHTKLETWEGDRNPDKPPKRTIIIQAMQEVGPSIFFSLLIITVSFLPVFTLEATEGRLFRPLAFTKTYSMGFAAILAVTLVPALAVLVIRGRIHGEKKNPLNRILIALYAPVVRFVVRFRWLVVGMSAVAMIVTIPIVSRLGGEFMPPLNEGSILYMPTAPPGMSIAEASKALQSMDKKLKTFPEVQSVFGKMGRARTATDPAPLSMAETVIVLKPKDQWREGMTWDKLIKEMDLAMTYPGMPNIWWMPIQTRTEMLATGIRSALGIKVYGATLEEIEQSAVAIEQAIQNDPELQPYTRSVFAERVTGGYFLDFTVKREEAARYGLTTGDVEDIVQTAIGGMNISQTIEGRERYPIQVRYARQFRDNLDSIRKVLVPTPTGTHVPISHVADIQFNTGAPMIRSEDGRLVGFVFVDVTDIGIADYVHLARKVVDENANLAKGVRLSWAGQFQYFERAKAKLYLVVPLTLLLVVFLLYLSTKSMAETVIVLLAVPFSAIGAFWLLYMLDYNMSVAVWVGLIALAGLDAETGVVMLLYLKLSHRKWIREGNLQTPMDLENAIVDGAAHRIRPKLMTVITTITGLLPLMLSTGTGADVMKRIAAPMVGGLATSFLLELTVYPAIFAIWQRRSIGRRA